MRLWGFLLLVCTLSFGAWAVVTIPDRVEMRATNSGQVKRLNVCCTVTWTAPTQNTDGSALTDLAGYRIYYGQTASTITQSITVANPSLTSYRIPGVEAWSEIHVQMLAFSVTNRESYLTGSVTHVVGGN